MLFVDNMLELLVSLISPLTSSFDEGVRVPIPTKLVCRSITKLEPTANPPAIVEVAFVEVALNAPNVGVDVATTAPEAFVESIEFRATDGRLRAPEKVDDAVENSPPVNPITVDVEL